MRIQVNEIQRQEMREYVATSFISNMIYSEVDESFEEKPRFTLIDEVLELVVI